MGSPSTKPMCMAAPFPMGHLPRSDPQMKQKMVSESSLLPPQTDDAVDDWSDLFLVLEVVEVEIPEGAREVTVDLVPSPESATLRISSVGVQVRSLTPFYSVDISQSKISVKNVVFTSR